jgi:hypothetical protein
MTPYRGIGAKIAIKDAARLKRALAAARRGECDLIARSETMKPECWSMAFVPCAIR